MDNVKPIDFRDIKFERDTKVDYENGDAIVNSVFRLYDTDHSGDFSDNEWFNYLTIQRHIESRRDNLSDSEMSNAQKYYRRKADKMLAQIEKIERKSAYFTLENFDLLREFHKSHPNVSLMVKENEDEIPSGYKIYDIEAFGMGYSEKYKSSLRYGYIEGLETLTPKERREYLRILNKALKETKQRKEYEQKHAELVNEYMAMRDMPDWCAMNGVTEKMDKKDEKNALLKCQEIRTAENPFLQDLLRVEQEIDALHRKPNRTQADAEQLNRLYVQSQQLLYASRSWMFTDSDFDMFKYRTGGNNFFMAPEFTQAEGRITLSQTKENSNNVSYNSQNNFSQDEQNMGDERIAKTAYTAEFGISSYHRDKSLSFTSTITETKQKPTDKSNTQIYGNISTGAKIKGIAVNSGLSMNLSDYSNTFTPNITLQKGNFNLSINESLSTSNFRPGTIQAVGRPHFSGVNIHDENQNNSSLMHSSNITLSYYSPKVNSSMSANISNSRQSYSGSVSGNIRFNTNEFSISATPGLNAEYSITNYGVDMANQNLNITPSFDGNITYYNKTADFGAKFGVNESYAMTFSGHNQFETNSNLTLSGNIKYKKMGLGIHYNNFSSPQNITNSLGTQIRYNPTANINLSLGYIYSNQELQNGTTYSKNIVTVGGAITVKSPKKIRHRFLEKK